MSGLIREIMRKPTVKDILRGHLTNVSPDGGRTLARDLLWQDFEALFGVLGTLPAVVTSIAGGVAQMVAEINAKFSPRLLKDFLGSILKDVDTRELKDCRDSVAKLAGEMLAASPELREFILEKGPGIVARGINAGTEGINRLCREDPQLISTFLTRVIDNLDKPALNDATLNLVEAVLNQKLGLVPWTGRLLKRRLTRLARRLGIVS